MATLSASARTWIVPFICAIGICTLSSCGDAGSVSVQQSAMPATTIYVVQRAGPVPEIYASAILQFPVASKGSALPSSILNVLPELGPTAVATDTAGDIYVGGQGNSGPEVAVYAAGSNGTATPFRRILGGTGSFAIPSCLLVDTTGNLYVGDNNGTIAVFSNGASGSATPARAVSGTLTQLNGVFAMSMDGAGNLYASTSSGGSAVVAVFPPNANGNVPPSRAITHKSGSGIAVDSVGNVYAAEAAASSPGSYPSVLEFAAGASGAATPIKTLSGASTGMTTIGQLRIDGAGNLFVQNSTVVTPFNEAFTLEQFSPNASGNAVPIATFTSVDWMGLGYDFALR